MARLEEAARYAPLQMAAGAAEFVPGAQAHTGLALGAPVFTPSTSASVWDASKIQNTTAVTENRLRDKARVEATLGLPEIGDDHTELFLTKGPWRAGVDGVARPRALVSKGYRRIVYGDHGPYVECYAKQINWTLFPSVLNKGDKGYYDEAFAQDGTKLYLQRKTVRKKHNPPKDGQWSTANDRAEGYADYMIGFVYVDASIDTLSVGFRGGANLAGTPMLVAGPEYPVPPKEAALQAPLDFGLVALDQERMVDYSGLRT